jgi:hypothetical protein
LLVVDVTLVTHAAGGAVKLTIIVVDSGLAVVLVHYRPPNPPPSPNSPRKKVKVIVLVDE